MKDNSWAGAGRCPICDRYLKLRKGALCPQHVRSVGPLGDEVRCSGTGKPAVSVVWKVLA